MRKITCCIVLLLLAGFTLRAQVVSTIAGLAGTTGNTNGVGSVARFNSPHGITCDKNGNVFIADRYNHLIRKITPAGLVSTFAGSGTPGSTDGQGTAASFNEPWGISADTFGNLYVADTKNYKIRKIDASGLVSTYAGVGTFGTTNGAANIASFGFPVGIAANKNGTVIYVADHNTHVIREISGGVVSNLAGTAFLAGANDGPGVTATFDHPFGIEIDQNGNIIVADEWNNRLRKITPSGTVTTFAGTGTTGSTDGAALAANFNYPWDIAVDSLNNIFVLDGFNHTVRRIDNLTNQVTTYVGTPGVIGSANGNGPAASFNNATGIVYNRADHCLYVADAANHLVRKITAVSSIILNLSVTGNATVCFGDSITLLATPAGLSNYSIYENNILLGSSANNSIKIPGLSTGAHTLNCTAIDGTGATAGSNSISVTVLAPFVPTITSTNGTSFCNGDSLKLVAQSGTNYTWSTGATTASIWVISPGSYSVTVTNSNGCDGTSAPVSITQLTAPTVFVIPTGPLNLCPDDSLSLIGSTGSSWLWSNGATTQNITVPAGTYTLTVTGSNGCKSSSTPVVLTNYSVIAPTVTPPGPITILQGDSIQLIANGGSTYQWSNGQSGSSVYINSGGNITVISTDNNGCQVPSTPVSVTVINASTMVSAGGTTSFCQGNNVVLSSAFSTGNQWLYNGIPIPGATAQQFTAYDSGYYTVGVWLNNNWLYSDSIVVTVFPSPQLATVNDTSICSGSTIQLQAQLMSGVTFHWYDQDLGGTLLANGNVYTTPALINSTTYYVETQNTNGCVSVGRVAVNVIVTSSPTANFTQTVQPQSGQYISTFNNITSNADTYFWIFGDTSIAGNTSTDPNPSYAYPAVGDYPVILIAINSNGCVDTLLRTISVNANNPTFLPTTFTPNGDGKNDVFRVRGDNVYLQEMMIYDQWGTLIYRTDASKPNWDGTIAGKHVQNGTYVYRIRITDKDNTSKELTGSVTVIK
ncbi:hypothetical protein BH11BAC2_BH11BAC2_01140 [soil metagenome]